MNSPRSLFLLSILGAAALVDGAGTRTLAAAPQPRATIMQAPIAFEANAGQFDASVQYVSRAAGYTLFLTDTGTTISTREHATIQLTFDGAAARRPTAIERLPGVVNYLIGSDPTRWRTDVPRYARVRYDAIYPGVDLVYYGQDSRHEYDLVVAANADPSRIALRVTGADRIERDATGGLQLITAGSAVTMRAPTVYQVVNGGRQSVAARYAIDGTRVGFDLGDYDTSVPLVIDPQLVFGTFLGGTGNGIDQANAVDVDAAGNAYIVGTTETTDFPTQSALQRDRRGASDAFVTKLSPDGRLIFSTYLGGESIDYGTAVAVRSNGVVYIAGETTSSNFPTRDAFQSSYAGNTDAFVLELNSEGTAVTKGTLIGGGDVEQLRGLKLTQFDEVVDPANVFADVVFAYGSTRSPNFPTVAPFQSQRGGSQDGFVVAFDRETFRPLLATYAGTPGVNTASQLMLNRETGDFFLSLLRDDDNGSHIARAQRVRTPPGSTGSMHALDTPSSRPTNAQNYWLYFGEWKVFEMWKKFSDEEDDDFGQSLLKGIKVSAESQIASCKDPKELKQLNAMLEFAKCGISSAPQRDHTYPSGAMAAGPNELSRAVFVLMWPQCIPITRGGTCNERGALIYVDDELKIVHRVNVGGQRGARTAEFIPVRGFPDIDGQLQILGQTTDPALPVKDPVQATYQGSTEGFLLTANAATGEAVTFSYLGGSSFDTVVDMAIDHEGNRWIVGITQSSNFPTTRSGVQPEMRGRVDSFVVKISP